MCSFGGEDSFESALFCLPVMTGLVLIFVYDDNLLTASQEKQEGEPN